MAPASNGTHKPVNAYRMSAALKNLYYRLTPASSSSSLPTATNGAEFVRARTGEALFTKTDPAVDGAECLHDCTSCSVKYPSKFSIDETEQLYGHVKGWSTHMIVATGKADWVRDVADEKGSIMEAADQSAVKPSNGRMMLSASNMPVPDYADHSTTVLLLPGFQLVDHVTPKNTPDVIDAFINAGPTNTTPLRSAPPSAPALPADSDLRARPCPHQYLILLCSHKTRDARCGQSAPLLRKEFERHLRPLGLYRDLHDERPGGVGIYFINHVGGHKFSANVIIYRKTPAIDGPEGINSQANGHDDSLQETDDGEAAQGIWLARVRPEDCENIVRYTVLQGKVLKPERQLRGGFDRAKGLISW